MTPEQYDHVITELKLRIIELERQLSTSNACAKTWRAEYASRIMAGLMTGEGDSAKYGIETKAQLAVEAADVLMKELNK